MDYSQESDLDQISDIHWHFINMRIVELLDIFQGSFIFLCHEINGHAFTTKTAATTNSVNKEKYIKYL